MTWLTPRTHPIQFLLYLEWSLLFIVFASEALRGGIFHVPRSPTLNLLCLLGFTLLGLALPQKKLGTKIAYTVFELRLYALQAKDMAMLTERNRVAREIHDSLGHSLTRGARASLCIKAECGVDGCANANYGWSCHNKNDF